MGRRRAPPVRMRSSYGFLAHAARRQSRRGAPERRPLLHAFPLPPPHAFRCRASGGPASEGASEQASERACERRSEPGHATTCHVPRRRAFQRAREFTQVVLRRRRWKIGANPAFISRFVSRLSSYPFHVPREDDVVNSVLGWIPESRVPASDVRIARSAVPRDRREISGLAYRDGSLICLCMQGVSIIGIPWESEWVLSWSKVFRED